MNGWEQTLVIILSAVLAVFLSLAIVATIKIIQILDQIKRVTAKAEKITDKAEEIGEFFRRANIANSIVGTIAGIINGVRYKASGRRKGRGGQKKD